MKAGRYREPAARARLRITAPVDAGMFAHGISARPPGRAGSVARLCWSMVHVTLARDRFHSGIAEV